MEYHICISSITTNWWIPEISSVWENTHCVLRSLPLSSFISTLSHSHFHLLQWPFLMFSKVWSIAYLDWATPLLPWSCAPLNSDTPCSRVSSITSCIHLLQKYKFLHWNECFVRNTLNPDSWIFLCIPFPWAVMNASASDTWFSWTVIFNIWLLLRFISCLQPSSSVQCPPTQSLKLY